MKKTVLVNGVLIGLVALALSFSACPIAPDFPSDSGVDSGVVDSGVVDAGIDAGAYGSIGATLGVSDSINTYSLAWNGTDVSGSTLDSATQVTLRGNNAAYGTFLLQLQNLTAGGTGEVWSAVNYSEPSGDDIWTCTNTLVTGCTVDVTLSNFDGIDISGTFAISFPADSVGNTAALTSGSFAVTLE